MTGSVKPDNQPLTLNNSKGEVSIVSPAPVASPRQEPSNQAILPTQPPTFQLLLSHGEVFDTTHLMPASTRCTVCRDVNGKLVFYRPSAIPLHSLLQLQDDIDSPPTNLPTANEPTGLDPAHLGTPLSPPASHDSAEPPNDSVEPLMIPKQHQPHVTLYDATNHAPLWSLWQQAWESITFVCRQLAPRAQTTTITTTTFTFAWEDEPTDEHREVIRKEYQWHMIAQPDASLDLYCTHQNRPIALLTKQASRLLFYSTDNNPFRQTDALQWEAFLTLSGLLLYDLITSQWRSLGGNPEALHWMIQRQHQAADLTHIPPAALSPTSPPPVMQSSFLYHQQSPPSHHPDMTPKLDDDDDDMSYHQRWSTTSMKSLELDPGCMQCWWGSHCWWSVFPCCMPGGWCDRLWIKWRGQLKHRHHHPRHPDHRHRSRITRRMQGWQQQEE
ncbi:hypothetical protein DM01DRAFT_1330816 [Hesseltinella vesiculosa]|uniref:Uncharacterized protein n=1 Tax=Hesseltinella vesiculosa TaxID=101127 RepID=A0A1X2GX70_9FUNG|nr:hypothetical protein DM01DRAFT_1330816 [Hesseltinella vesiculosa]